MSRRIAFRFVLGLAALAACDLTPRVSQAQVGQTAGVEVDAKGVLHVKVHNDPTGQLTKQRIDESKAKLKPDVLAKSLCRKISLNRLEKALADRIAKGLKPTDEMHYLAGLFRLQYVFYYPDTKDIVIAGPPRAGSPDLSGRVRGMHDGPPGDRVGRPGRGRCEPFRRIKTAAGHRLLDRSHAKKAWPQMQGYSAKLGGAITPDADTDSIVDGMRSSLGLQTVRVVGRAGRHALRPGDGRGRLSHEAHRHRAGAAAGQDGQLCRPGQPGHVSAATPCSAGTSCPTINACESATTAWRWNWSARA